MRTRFEAPHPFHHEAFLLGLLPEGTIPVSVRHRSGVGATLVLDAPVSVELLQFDGYEGWETVVKLIRRTILAEVLAARSMGRTR